MSIAVKIIKDSVSPDGVRLTTYQLTYPRFIHAELMTHRVFSRNASSSRAIPVLKALALILEDMALPIHWGANQPGMQANAELPAWKRFIAETLWRGAGYVAVGFAYALAKLGAHKQLVNRIVEPWSHISVVVTATNFANWDALRNHKDAQPEIRELARKMRAERDSSVPRRLMRGQWHVPYVSDTETRAHLHDIEPGSDAYSYAWQELREISAARCARVSYLTHDGFTPDREKDAALFARLVIRENDDPIHASPTEHQATPDFKVWVDEDGKEWSRSSLHGNFTGWIQHRQLLKGQYHHEPAYTGPTLNWHDGDLP